MATEEVEQTGPRQPNDRRKSEGTSNPLLDSIPREILEALPPEIVERLASAQAIIIEGISHRDIGSEMRETFAALDELPSTHPRVQRLKEYGKALDDHLTTLRERFGMSDVRAEALLRDIPEDQRQQIFARVVARLRNETSYLDELDDVGIADQLATGIEKGKYSARVKFYSPDHPKAQKWLARDIGGTHSWWRNKIEIYENPPTPTEMLTTLATRGVLPGQVATLDHELVHSTQTSHLKRIAFWGLPASHFALLTGLAISNPYVGFGYALATTPFVKPVVRSFLASSPEKRILKEAHAYEAMASSPSHHEPLGEDPGAIVSGALAQIAPLAVPFYLPVASTAFRLVHSLRLVGLNDREIGNLVTREKWSAEKQTFPSLEDRLSLEMEGMGANSNEERSALLQALHIRFELEIARQRRLAAKITMEELERAQSEQ